MSVKYVILKRLVRLAGIKKQWLSKTTEELLENRRKSNAKNRIPELRDADFDISRIEVMGFPVLKLIHKKSAERANLWRRHGQRAAARVRQKGAALCEGDGAGPVRALLSALHGLPADKSL